MYEYEEKQTAWTKIKSFIRECVRVFKITKKPTREEFFTISKVSGLGLLIIGLIGFLVHLVNVLVFN
ncbi:MAG: protein translocase SEC61 complex subunit gamma [Candidatus Woesearchaeota archaeon]